MSIIECTKFFFKNLYFLCFSFTYSFSQQRRFTYVTIQLIIVYFWIQIKSYFLIFLEWCLSRRQCVILLKVNNDNKNDNKRILYAVAVTLLLGGLQRRKKRMPSKIMTMEPRTASTTVRLGRDCLLSVASG